MLCATLSHGHIQCVGIARIKTIAYFCALQSFDSQNVYGQTFWLRFSQSSAICRQLDKAKVFNQLAYVYVACMCMCVCVCVRARLQWNLQLLPLSTKFFACLRARHESSNLAKLLSRVFRSTYTHTHSHTQTSVQ